MMSIASKKMGVFFLLILLCLCFTPAIVGAQALKTSIAEILKNPDRFDGKVVQIGAKVTTLESRTSRRGNPYTILTVSDDTNASLKVFTFGTLSLERGDKVVVTGRYSKIKRVPPRHVFYNEIDASEGSVRKIQ